jgi:hypothetical protein
MSRAVKQLAGWRSEPTAILAELGIPNTRTIRRIRLAKFSSAAENVSCTQHTCSPTRLPRIGPTLQTTFETEMKTTTQELKLMEIWQDIQAPVQSLARPQGEEDDPITRRRTHWGTKIKKNVWEKHRSKLTSGKTPYNTGKIKCYVDMTHRDLQRKHLSQCAVYLAQDLTSNQEAALLQLRTGCSLLAVDRIEEQNVMEPGSRCDACRLRNPALQGEVVENAQHALLTYCKRPHADAPKDWEQRKAQALTAAKITVKGRDNQDGPGKRLQWRQLSNAAPTRLAQGVTPPAEWVSAHTGVPRVMQELHKEFIRISAEYLPDVCKGLGEYQQTVVQSLEAGDDTYQAVHSIWDYEVDFYKGDRCANKRGGLRH